MTGRSPHRRKAPYPHDMAASSSPLIHIADVKAELHAHTVASDGHMTIQELIERAVGRGFHTIAVTDHSWSSPEADGLSPDELRRHIDAVREVAARYPEIAVLAGSEVDILEDGSLDYDDDLLAELDIVVASVHHHLVQSPEVATRRLVRAVSHPLVHVLGHPTARWEGIDRGLEPDMHALAAAAAEHNTALEINCNPVRLDLCKEHVEIAREAGALIAINCDVHRPEQFDRLPLGVGVAHSANVLAEHCLNTWDAQRLHAWLAAMGGGRS